MRIGPRPALVAGLAAVTMLGLTPAPAAAHAELVLTQPAAGSTLDAPPEEVVLTFDGELDPDGSGFVVTGADGRTVGTGDVDLDVADRNVLRGAVTIAGPGIFTVNWTARSIDGHVEEDGFNFAVADDDAPAPDTALRPGSTLRSVGLLLMLAAAALATVPTARRRDRRP